MDRASKPPKKPDVAAFKAELRVVCPGTNLSPGARELAEIPRRGCRLGPPLTTELRLLADLLRTTPRSSPDWIRIVDRIAGTSFELELETHRACIELSIQDFKTEEDLARGRRVVPTYTTNLKIAESLSRWACDILARDPEKTWAPCAFRVPEPAREERDVCREEPRSIQARLPSLTCNRDASP